VRGHVNEIEFESEFKHWNMQQLLDLFDANVKIYVPKDTLKVA